jgi:outer membrane lipoprotein carrier protein
MFLTELVPHSSRPHRDEWASPPISWYRRLFLITVLLSAIAAPAQTPAAILHTVDAHYNHLNSLRTRYTEHYTGLGLDRTESGILTLRKPGRMRWAYDTPAGKLFLLDGKFAWFYTPGDAQAQRISAKQMDDLRTPLRFLLGHTELAKELDHIDVTPDGENFRIAGIPKGMQQRVRDLVLIVTPTGAIRGMKIDETDGAVTDFTFSSPEENIPTKDADFSFVPPPGVTVVNATLPM